MARTEPISAKFKRSKKFKKLQKQIGQRIRQLREEQELTLEEAEELLSIDFRHIARIEAGESNMTLVTLHRVALGYGVSIHDLLP